MDEQQGQRVKTLKKDTVWVKMKKNNNAFKVVRHFTGKVLDCKPKNKKTCKENFLTFLNPVGPVFTRRF